MNDRASGAQLTAEANLKLCCARHHMALHHGWGDPFDVDTLMIGS